MLNHNQCLNGEWAVEDNEQVKHWGPLTAHSYDWLWVHGLTLDSMSNADHISQCIRVPAILIYSAGCLPQLWKLAASHEWPGSHGQTAVDGNSLDSVLRM